MGGLSQRINAVCVKEEVLLETLRSEVAACPGDEGPSPYFSLCSTPPNGKIFIGAATWRGDIRNTLRLTFIAMSGNGGRIGAEAYRE
jgi:hypothetical protein